MQRKPICLPALLLLTDGTVLNFLHRSSVIHLLHCSCWLITRMITSVGFAFVYFEDERDAADAIRGTDNIPFGYERRCLSVEWAKGERGRHRGDGPKSGGNQRPTKTLLVINFDPICTRIRDIEKHFEPYGKVLHVRIRRNFAFVQFENQEEATRALECTHMSGFCGVLLKDDDERGNKYNNSPRRDYGRQRDSLTYRRSPSPMYRRNRPSPD
ncbi:hypothetical protein RND71_035152 [Anisodus tanguticus]|uniref:RRM domain-containing protein n=1 Tax=Anisodus tanguticus TaxID=243964 RepID=A0AAE1R503_9SOLA|nr:hypothetical protein RND71_035152 [Anisodus tanguticus]